MRSKCQAAQDADRFLSQVRPGLRSVTALHSQGDGYVHIRLSLSQSFQSKEGQRGCGTQECSSNGQDLEYTQAISQASVQNLGRRPLELQGRRGPCSLLQPQGASVARRGGNKKKENGSYKPEIFLLNHNKKKTVCKRGDDKNQESIINFL